MKPTPEQTALIRLLAQIDCQEDRVKGFTDEVRHLTEKLAAATERLAAAQVELNRLNRLPGVRRDA